MLTCQDKLGYTFHQMYIHGLIVSKTCANVKESIIALHVACDVAFVCGAVTAHTGSLSIEAVSCEA